MAKNKSMTHFTRMLSTISKCCFLLFLFFLFVFVFVFVFFMFFMSDSELNERNLNISCNAKTFYTFGLTIHGIIFLYFSSPIRFVPTERLHKCIIYGNKWRRFSICIFPSRKCSKFICSAIKITMLCLLIVVMNLNQC